ncbi:MAG: hypothetical protein WB992_09325 [Bryobacteraceae bacterium]
MNRFAAVLTLAFWGALSFAQTDADSSKEHPLRVTKVVRLNYVSPHVIVDLLSPGNPAAVVGDNALKAVVIKGEASVVAATEQAIKELDVQQAKDSDIEVTVYVIGATSKSQSQTPPPKAIEPVVKQLQGIFPYENYELMDTMLIRSREGRPASTTGMIKNLGSSQDIIKTYSITYDVASNPSQADPHSIRFERFVFHANESTGSSVGFDTDFDIHEGQKVVVGKTNVDAGDSALFVVLTARVLE